MSMIQQAGSNAGGIYRFACFRMDDVLEELDHRFGPAAWRARFGIRPIRAALALGLLVPADLVARQRWDAVVPGNLVVNTGLDAYLSSQWLASGLTAQHYLGLITGTSPTIAAADTMASHAGWTEFLDYEDVSGNRVDLTAALGAVASQSLTVSAPIEYTIDDTGNVNGAFATTGLAKGGTTGTLVSAGVFAEGNRPVVASDVLQVSITFTQAAA